MVGVVEVVVCVYMDFWNEEKWDIFYVCGIVGDFGEYYVDDIFW